MNAAIQDILFDDNQVGPSILLTVLCLYRIPSPCFLNWTDIYSNCCGHRQMEILRNLTLKALNLNLWWLKLESLTTCPSMNMILYVCNLLILHRKQVISSINVAYSSFLDFSCWSRTISQQIWHEWSYSFTDSMLSSVSIFCFLASIRGMSALITTVTH